MIVFKFALSCPQIENFADVMSARMSELPNFWQLDCHVASHRFT